LGLVNAADPLYYFQFHYQLVVDEQINAISDVDSDSPIRNRE